MREKMPFAIAIAVMFVIAVYIAIGQKHGNPTQDDGCGTKTESGGNCIIPSDAKSKDTKAMQTRPESVPNGLDPAVVKASVEFKANTMFRQGPAKVLVPHLREGMSKAEIKMLLGEPNKISENGLFWTYTTGYSLFIDVRWDQSERVATVCSCN